MLKLHVFLVDTGVMFTFDMEMALGRYFHVIILAAPAKAKYVHSLGKISIGLISRRATVAFTSCLTLHIHQ